MLKQRHPQGYAGAKHRFKPNSVSLPLARPPDVGYHPHRFFSATNLGRFFRLNGGQVMIGSSNISRRTLLNTALSAGAASMCAIPAPLQAQGAGAVNFTAWSAAVDQVK